MGALNVTAFTWYFLITFGVGCGLGWGITEGMDFPDNIQLAVTLAAGVLTVLIVFSLSVVIYTVSG